MRISDWSSDVCSSDIEDLYVEGKNPSDLSREIETELAVYIQDPLVTVMVGGFVGTFPQQVRIVGEASVQQAITYRANMTVLDVIIRSEEHTSELQSLMRLSYAGLCLKKNKQR